MLQINFSLMKKIKPVPLTQNLRSISIFKSVYVSMYVGFPCWICYSLCDVLAVVTQFGFDILHAKFVLRGLPCALTSMHFKRVYLGQGCWFEIFCETKITLWYMDHGIPV